MREEGGKVQGGGEDKRLNAEMQMACCQGDLREWQREAPGLQIDLGYKRQCNPEATILIESTGVMRRNRARSAE